MLAGFANECRKRILFLLFRTNSSKFAVMNKGDFQQEKVVMEAELDTIERTVQSDYKYGFVSDLEADEAPKGLNENIIRFISSKKNEPEWMLEWRLKAYRHWLNMKEPNWANVKFEPINYQDIIYYSAPKQKVKPE